MTPRPALAAHKRPLSAIFIGNISNSASNHLPSLPDLPDPPSPSSSSGLPSPPATNSTSSGSTGDNSNSTGAVSAGRKRSDSSASDMFNGSRSSKTRRSRASSDDEDDDNDEDNTAKLSDDRRRAMMKSPDNVTTLARVKSLSERNRMVLDKLSSYPSARLNTPSPPVASRSTRSPVPPSTSNSSSSSSTATSSRLSSSSTSAARHDRQLQNEPLSQSGSETERERAYSSDERSTSPPSIFRSPHLIESKRQRRISAPSSPAKMPLRLSRTERAPSPGSSKAKKRVSMQDDLTAAALAAVASSRRSPTNGTTNGKRARQPLPREFRDRSSLDGRTSGELQAITPQRTGDRTTSPGVLVGRGSPSPNSSASTLSGANNPQSPRPPRTSRSSTVREMARRYQTRWLSEDLSSTSVDADLIDDGRQQGLRGGSADSQLGVGTSTGRSLVGEGLRAAGLTKRQDDVFSHDGQSQRRTRLSGGLGTRPILSDNWNDGDSRSSTSRTTGDRTSPTYDRESRTAATISHRSTPGDRSVHDLLHRPLTSTGYSEDANSPRTAPPILRHKSAYPLSREQDRERQYTVPPSTSRQQQNSQSAQDRIYSSPSNGRQSSVAPLALAPQHTAATSDHARLMLDSLSMFESHLGRLPSTSAAASISDLSRSAQNLVQSANTLNSLLRSGTNHALEEQIDAEVGDNADAIDPVEVWRTVGGEYRESLRISDELVRTMTGFLLGIGKLLRETTTGQHARASSVEEDSSRRLSPDVGVTGGRRSVESNRSTELRRSLEYSSRDHWESTTGRRSTSRSENRPTSSLSVIHDRDRSPTISRDRSATLNGYADDGNTAHRDSPRTAGLAGSVRRLFSPREQRERLHNSANSATAEEMAQAEALSTPASGLSRRRTLPPLAIPPPLPTLPSESLLSRKTSLKTTRRSKVSTTSNATVRGSSIFPLITTPNSTTAVTTLSVSNSPEKATTAFPLLRSVSSDSAHNVTFSRPSTVSVSALNDVHNRDGRRRTISSSSAMEAGVPTTPLSGSETERDTRRTISGKSRTSLDAVMANEHSRGGAGPPPERKERRRTVTDIFPRD